MEIKESSIRIFFRTNQGVSQLDLLPFPFFFQENQGVSQLDLLPFPFFFQKSIKSRGQPA